jgi:desumoylating isopeptidase 1
LKQRYEENLEKSKAAPSQAVVNAFSWATTTLVANLPSASIFPLLDVWRLAILEPAIAQASLAPLVQVLTSTNESLSSPPRATPLTLLRLSANALGLSLSRSLLVTASSDVRVRRAALTSVLVNTLLHPDRLVHVAAASLAFNVGAWVQRGRVARVQGGDEEAINGIRESEEDGEWEVELISAVAEALGSEEESEDVGKLFQLSTGAPLPTLSFSRLFTSTAIDMLTQFKKKKQCID